MPHIEVLPNSKEAPAPGWAYVPDTGEDPSKAALNPKGPRRARNVGSTSSGPELSARQQTAIHKRLAELDKDNVKEIPVPKGADGGAAGRGTRAKQSSAVKKILQSHKTFTNHLADEEAMLALQQQQQAPLKDDKTNPNNSTTTTTTTLAPSDDALTLPRPPSPQTLAALLSAPPLPYAAARSKPRTGPGTPPRRRFCEMCGYWGRVRCGKCGSRVCGLECRDAHEESGGCYRF